ncbi:hypothetical protein [Streptomyces sp. CC224B]|uniref:hypothetical protein n=1 Tax=Streptomyces sp. CC224B TaxID=3044571 RepID=UPI0024A959BF|nr:hypothetical protein [Streptomyces sp. CC224B]
MRTPVDGEVFVHYSQIYVESDPDSDGPDLEEAFAGQSAGLCGAAAPGALWLTTGLHTGDVRFRVEVHDEVPPLDDAWEDVVEVSFRPVSERTALTLWGGEGAWELGLRQVDYRVRYSAQGMDEGDRLDTRVDGEPHPTERYLLQFWPAASAPDRVLKCGSRCAAYWHDYARRQPPPPTPEKRAEAERLARLAEEEAERQEELAYERWEWGGREPSEALRRVEGNVLGVRDFDAALVHAIDAAPVEVQRAVALLAARRACEVSGLVGIDWIEEGLAALAEGRALPLSYADEERVWDRLEADPRVPQRTVRQPYAPPRPPFRPPTLPGGKPPHEDAMVLGPAGRTRSFATAGTDVHAVVAWIGEPGSFPGLEMSQPHSALSALRGAAEADPLRAALDAVYSAIHAYGEDYPVLLEEVARTCG